ncbi:phenazine-specific anthranilate synthase component I [Amorphoplanes auranticolor]|uniref:anthranilate synthase n=1 Tax=Actinoplanes auranticolor TaxID=47988 RepID=A0A919S9V6_9ACTN|nr:anthranilate synthase family protein [Actinoplanes auranticolor]GIM66990.1 phenazine-specific anthranilate synthase component I [Actinoplanes auranticolor]
MNPVFAGLPAASAFALLHRPGTAAGEVLVLVGEPLTVPSLADLPVPAAGGDGQVLAVLPYRQITERGLHCVDDRTPLVAIEVRGRRSIPVADALRWLPGSAPLPEPGDFDVSDADYAATVRQVLDGDIGAGHGSNFVIRRDFRAAFDGWSPHAALALFRRLLLAERGAYWTFVVCRPGRTLAGATPECHLRVAGGVATMNPISGTYRYPPAGPDTAGLLRFLGDRKETGELLMVVDEELKMMARVCDGGGRVRGPWLRAMSRLAHTEYLIDGPTSLDARDLLRLTMPAPTVTGSPVASACRVIAGHERSGRGYYGGVIALLGPRSLDAALIIRTADIDDHGQVRMGVGATLVRDSSPAAEAAETRAKAAALVAAMRAPGARAGTTVRRAGVLSDPRVTAALRNRNDGLSHFWRGREAAGPAAGGPPAGRRLLLIEAEDDFTAMLATVARSLGVTVRISRWDAIPRDGYDVVLVGPGPGDPGDRADPRIAGLHRVVRRLLSERTPVLAVCLGHQILAGVLGLPVTRLGEPAQGARRTIDWYGRPQRVGFYNSFTAVSDRDVVHSPLVAGPVHVLRDRVTAAVHALRASRFRTTQFHLESLLTEHGPAILRDMLNSVPAAAPIPPVSPVPLIRTAKRTMPARPDGD